jgi:hypothetical protein
MIASEIAVGYYCLLANLKNGLRFPSTFIQPTRMIFRHASARRAPAGAVVTMIVGFNWGGWSLESTAAKRADDSSRSAVIAVLAPICVDKFQRSADATNNCVELKKVSSYMQGSFVEKRGLGDTTGQREGKLSAVAQACATLLGNLK